MVDANYRNSTQSQKPKHTESSSLSQCPWCRKEIIITFAVDENNQVRPIDVAQNSYRPTSSKVSSHTIRVTKRDNRGTITGRAQNKQTNRHYPKRSL